MATDNFEPVLNYLALTLLQRFTKRSFDFIASFILLLITIPIILLAAILATIDTRENGFFSQIRVGQEGKLFRVFKIRTMRNDQIMTTTVTTSRDARITGIGQFLRRTKIDELPQLINVLIGDMSIVGPRPDVPGFADQLQGEDRIILSVRPGITGPATLRFKNEQDVLANQSDPESYNKEVIYPQKVKLNQAYLENYSFLSDIKYIYQTIIK